MSLPGTEVSWRWRHTRRSHQALAVRDSTHDFVMQRSMFNLDSEFDFVGGDGGVECVPIPLLFANLLPKAVRNGWQTDAASRHK